MSTSNNRRGGGRGGGGKGGKHRQPQSREVTVSKALSFLLRHGAKDEGVQLDEGGWANVRDVVCWFFGCYVWLFLDLLCEFSSFEKSCRRVWVLFWAFASSGLTVLL